MTTQLSRVANGNDLPAHSPEVDFAIVLSRMLDDVKNDPAEMRNAVYELARIKLQREGWLWKPQVSVLEMRRMLLALEVAIERVESAHSGADALPAPSSDRLIESREITVPEPVTRLPDPLNLADHAPLAEPGGSRSYSKWLWLSVWLLQAAAAITLVVALFVILSQQFALFRFRLSGETIVHTIPKTERQGPAAGSPAHVAGPQAPSVAAPFASAPQSPGLPLPNVYGVYASSNGQLRELDLLPGRVPDPRVLVSAAITKPARTILPDGKIVFVVYRRDLAASPPERVAVRVIARIARATKFSSSGQVVTTPLTDLWAMRDKSHEFRVAPVGENPDMLLIQPENPDFVLPAGRYGLVLKGQAYDFSVAGPITSASCLERVEAVNGTFYSECLKP